MAPRRARGKPETPQDRLLRKWSIATTRESNPDQPLSEADREKFFQDAHELAYAEDDSRQAVICALASHGGLKRIVQLLTDEQLLGNREDLLHSTLLPFLNVVGHPKALSSGMLAAYIAAIYNTMFGAGGEHALKLYIMIAEIASRLSLDDLETILTVLAKLLDVNESANLFVKEFGVVVTTIGTAMENAKIEDGLALYNAQKSIDCCKNRLGMDKTDSTRASFRDLKIDGPGDLSPHGPRHENDFADIRKVHIFLTFGEICSDRTPYLPVLDPSKLHLQGVDALIDRHFRLYREDSLGDVRDAIRSQLERNKSSITRRYGTDRGTRMNVYYNLGLQRLKCDRFEGPTITVSIDQPSELRGLLPKLRHDWWASKGRLRPNTLVCLLDPAGQAMFCTVVEIRMRYFDQKDSNTKGRNMPLPWQDLGSDPRRAILSVIPADVKDASALAGYFSSSKDAPKMTLLEFPEILIQSFQPTLTALQSLIGKNTLPFANLVAPQDGTSSTVTVDPPTYSQQRNFRFDLNCLMLEDVEMTLSPEKPFDMEKLIEGSTLDQKQAESLVNALTRRLALCQGPPGTGKSFTSVALLRVLLATKSLADLGPILIVTYTNHALDQTLENCLDKGISKIVRIGSGSKNWRMEELNVRVASSRMEKTKVEKEEGKTQETKLTNVTALLNDAIHDLESGKPNSHEQFLSAVDSFWKTKKRFDSTRQEIDQRCLADADIIGMTTSGLARNLKMLKSLPIKVVLVEEAGEVLEAHTLTALLPSVEHAILIGDHLQLKPSVNKYDLSSESHRGIPYSLDISMFERLVNPPKNMVGVKLPCSTLETQRRMRPTISSLIRQTLYPNLKDNTNVELYPEVAGMKDCVYWLDHSIFETGAEGNAQATMSKSNDFEVRLVVSLVAHLMSQGVYEPKDVAVITPYLGQLFKLRSSLSEVYEVALDDRDTDALQKAGITDNLSCASNTREKTEKTSLLQALKVATVDNFQGEEAKIVIVSLVRSNRENNCGFLKSSNRINVLLSRAQHGMYIIGNSKTSAGVPMWTKVLGILKDQGNIGPNLRLACSRHPEAVMEVSKADDFHRLSPEGGCTLPCGRPLPCGHACLQVCHSELRHTNVYCEKPCIRMKDGCTHPCQNFCGEPCESRCEERLKVTVKLPCGHVRNDVRCWENQNKASIKCTVSVNAKAAECGHMIQIKCTDRVHQDDYLCETVCGGKMECGHNCPTLCYQCPGWDNEKIHAPCQICHPADE